jgi:excisionase family DNA binding protein
MRLVDKAVAVTRVRNLVATSRRPDLRAVLLTVEEVAELLKVSVSWVYDRTRSRGVNRIPGFRLGKYWRFQESEVLAWLERQQSGGRVNA